MFSAGLVLFAGGCAQVYDVKVDAMQNVDAARGHAYRIVPKDPARAESDPAYGKAVVLVRNALSGHGMYEAASPEKAEVEVSVDFDVGAPRKVVQEDPLSMRVGPKIVTSDGRIIRDDYHSPIGMLRDGPDYRVSETYEKRLTIVAREAKPADAPRDAPARELWRVDVKVDDEKDSVDAILPVLVGAAVDNIDTDSGSQRSKRLSDKSEPVSFVKGGG